MLDRRPDRPQRRLPARPTAWTRRCWSGSRQIERDHNFGNAREARKLLEGMRKAQSGRLRALGRMPSRDDLRTLVLDDLLVATR